MPFLIEDRLSGGLFITDLMDGTRVPITSRHGASIEVAKREIVLRRLERMIEKSATRFARNNSHDRASSGNDER